MNNENIQLYCWKWELNQETKIKIPKDILINIPNTITSSNISQLKVNKDMKYLGININISKQCNNEYERRKQEIYEHSSKIQSSHLNPHEFWTEYHTCFLEKILYYSLMSKCFMTMWEQLQQICKNPLLSKLHINYHFPRTQLFVMELYNTGPLKNVDFW